MSLLADLLSKAKNEGEKNTAVPPHLASIITRASDKKKKQARFVIFAAIVLFIVIVGFGVVYYMDIYLKPSGMLKTSTGPKTPPAVPAQPQTPAAQTPQAQAPAAPAQQTQAPAEEPPQKTAAKPSMQANVANEGPKKDPQISAAAPKADIPAEPKSAKPALTQPEPAVTVKGVKKQAPEKAGMGVFEHKPAPSTTQERPGREPIEDRRKGDRDSALYAARNFEESGNLTQAIASYKKALQLDGRNYVIMTSLSGALIKTGAYAESVQYSRFALNTNRNYVPAMINLAIASIQLGNLTEGEQNLLRARSLEPANKSVLFNLALLYENQKKYQDAYGVYEKIAAANNGQGFTGMGRVLEKQGKRDEAKKLYRGILSSNTADAATKQYANERLIALGN